MKNSVKNMRKLFNIIIQDKSYNVYGIDSKEHESYNGEPTTWWVYYEDEIGELDIDSKNWIPYQYSMNRRLWDIRIKQYNTTKYKWDDIHFRNHTSVEMWCNNRLVYQFRTIGDDNGLSFAMAKVQYLKTVMGEHPYNFFEPETDNGRKIYWYGLPATIKTGYDAGEIQIVPEYSDLPKDKWWKELDNRESCWNEPPDELEEIHKEDRDECMKNDIINWGDALSDQHINWFRS